MESMKAVAPASRNAQVNRILAIVRDLHRTGGMDIYEIAEKYGTVTRTIRRDLDCIQAIGIPLIEEIADDGKRKRWQIAYQDKLAKLADLLEVSHYLALRVAMDGPVAKRSTLFAALEDLSDKVANALGAADHQRLRAIEGAFHSYEKFAYEETPPELFWPIITAIAERRICKVIYRAARPGQKEKEIRLLPLKIFSFQGALYLHAFVYKHENVITLNLQRMLSIRATDEKGTPPAGYRPEKLEETAFGVFVGTEEKKFRFHFSAELAPFIRERRWHSTQRLRDLDDGRVELTFTCADSPELKNWVASWRDGVEVLEPSSLRAELAALGRALTKRYGE